MPSKSSQKKVRVHIGPRDDAILALIEVTPLTARQVQKWSRSFEMRPFQSVRTTHGRLSLLATAGYLHKRSYGGVGHVGADNYFQLTRKGWRHVYRTDAPPPYPKRQAEPVVAWKETHTRRLADALIHMDLCARRRGFQMEIVSTEDGILIENCEGATRLDAEVVFTQDADPSVRFHRLIELEKSTRTLRSRRHRTKTWQNRAAVLDRHQDERIKSKDDRTRLLTFATESWQKVESIGRLFAEETLVPERTLFAGTYLPDFLAEEDALFHPVFQDHHCHRVSALPSWAIPKTDRCERLVACR